MLNKRINLVVAMLVFHLLGFGCRIGTDDTARLPPSDAVAPLDADPHEPDIEVDGTTTADSDGTSSVNSIRDGYTASDASYDNDSQEGQSENRNAIGGETNDAASIRSTDAGPVNDVSTVFGCEAEPVCSELGSVARIVCCLEDGTCGWTIIGMPFIDKLSEKCHAFSQAGTVDDACDDISIPYGMVPGAVITIPGCCRPDGYCGFIIEDNSIIENNTGCVAGADVNGTSQTCTPN